MGDGISNTQIQNFFQKDENEDLKNNFVGVFSMDYISRFKYHELIKEKKKENIHLQYLIRILIINQERIGGVF